MLVVSNECMESNVPTSALVVVLRLLGRRLLWICLGFILDLDLLLLSSSKLVVLGHHLRCLLFRRHFGRKEEKEDGIGFDSIEKNGEWKKHCNNKMSRKSEERLENGWLCLICIRVLAI